MTMNFSYIVSQFIYCRLIYYRNDFSSFFIINYTFLYLDFKNLVNIIIYKILSLINKFFYL